MTSTPRGQKPTTIWMPEQLAEQLDRKLARRAAGLRPSRKVALSCTLSSAPCQAPRDAPRCRAPPCCRTRPRRSPARFSRPPQSLPSRPSLAQPAQDELRLAPRALSLPRLPCEPPQ